MSIHKRPTSRGLVYDVRLRGPNGREYSRTFTTVKAAKRFESAERAARDRGSWIDPAGSATTFESWARRWLELGVAKSLGTRATDESILRAALLPVFGTRTIGSIRPLDVQDVVVRWSRVAKPRTVRRRYATLSAILNSAVDMDLLARSPCRGIQLPPVEPAGFRIVEPAEVASLAAELPVEYRPMLYIGATLGLRIGEVAGLRCSSLDLARGTLTVSESVGEAAGRLYLKGPKTQSSSRTVPLPSTLIEILRDHMTRFGRRLPSDFLFTAPQGGPVRPNHFRSRIWRPACRRAGLDDLGFHDLRRTVATVMVAIGVSVRDAQQILGHSDPRLLLGVYAKATQAGMSAATDMVAARLLPVHAPSANGLAMIDSAGAADPDEQPRTAADAG